MSKKKIEWQGGIQNTHVEQPISIKPKKDLTQKTDSPVSGEIQKITGKVNIRLEKKGRANNPMLVLFNFTDKNATHEPSLKKLCSDLKSKLACGGTVEEGKIYLTMQDDLKLKKILTEQFSITVK